MDDDQPDLFSATKGMVRPTDPNTSHEAAAGVVKRDKSKLQKKILEAFEREGPMTDMELEELPEFEKYAPTTISKRRTELYQRGELVMLPEERVNRFGSKMKVWGLP